MSPLSWSFGVLDLGGTPVVMDGFSAMVARALKSEDEDLLRILEHRAEVHGCGPCHCSSSLRSSSTSGS